MIYNQQNPFLTNNVHLACDQARVNYLDTLVRMQMYGGMTQMFLKTSQQKHENHLDMYRTEALRAASCGDISSASTQLAYIVTEWGLWKAFSDLIDAYGTHLDAADPDVVKDFVLAVQHGVVLWATELMNSWTEGDQKRKADQANLYLNRQTELYSGYRQIVQDQAGMLLQYDQRNQHYADAALKGAQQAQQGAQWMMGGVERINQQNLQNVVNMQQQAGQNIYWMAQSANGLHQQAGQNIQWMAQGVQHMYNHGAQVTSEAVKTQQAVRELVEQNSPVRKAIRRGGCAIALILAVPVAFVFAYLLLTHVVLPH